MNNSPSQQRLSFPRKRESRRVTQTSPQANVVIPPEDVPDQIGERESSESRIIPTLPTSHASLDSSFQ